MVNLVLKTLFDETDTLSVLNDDPAEPTLENNINFPTNVDIDSVLEGFTYVQEIIITWEYITSASFVNAGVNVYANPVLRFDNDVDLFEDISEIQVVAGTTVSKSFSQKITADLYIDTPADISYNFDVRDESGFENSFTGDQTFDVRATIKILGRQP